MSLTVLNGPVIQAGQSLSDPLDCTAGEVVRLTMPASWTGANLTFQISSDGVGYNDLYTIDGDEIMIPVVPGSAVVVAPLREYLKAVAFLKVRSGSRDFPVVQEAKRDFAVAIGPSEEAGTGIGTEFGLTVGKIPKAVGATSLADSAIEDTGTTIAFHGDAGVVSTVSTYISGAGTRNSELFLRADDDYTASLGVNPSAAGVPSEAWLFAAGPQVMGFYASDGTGVVPSSAEHGLAVTFDYDAPGAVNFWNLTDRIGNGGFYFWQKEPAAAPNKAAQIFGTPTVSMVQALLGDFYTYLGVAPGEGFVGTGGAMPLTVYVNDALALTLGTDLSARFEGNIIQIPSASVTPANNGDLMVQATSNTQITFKLKGSDGVVRSGSITLA